MAISIKQHHCLGFFLSLEVGRNVELVQNEHFSARRPLNISQYRIIKKRKIFEIKEYEKFIQQKTNRKKRDIAIREEKTTKTDRRNKT